MTETANFDPFNDRLSRDIRNALSSSLVKCLELSSLAPAREVADKFMDQDLPEVYRGYIADRLSCYEKAVHQLNGVEEDPIRSGLVLWDLELFFEVHEVLEHAWYDAGGDFKLILQALIRAAGVYIKLEHGFRPQAERIAAKAVDVLEEHRTFLEDHFEPELLISALRNCRIPAPKLLEGE